MKRQVHAKTQTHKKPKTKKQASKPRSCLVFPQVNGKKIESVELWLDSGERAIIVWFQDRTCLHFDLEPDLAVNTDYFDWRSGEQRVIQRWQRVRRTKTF